ncbi:MAG TPA: sulfatase [Candidatus Avipropionibacterium avicola]|uniref:Sulfatase n=1 Tax=Candidatus Avipropionibacterium avicola TaxID=2840701 RepID=A0A9D1GYC4_9ACTN|nr:sulfatase [Candidatus Avipropionibacterium avicola]
MRRPNILIVHWHDLGTHLSAYGHPVESPHSQALADQSLVFDHWFATTPLCSPARGSLWTGRYPHSNGLQGLTHRGWDYHPGERTLSHHLGDAGYHSCLIGLQHEANDPERLGFTELRTERPSWCDDVAEQAVEWIGEHAADDAPWMLTCGMTEVHRPWPESRYDPVDPATVTVPPWLPDNDLTRRDLASYEGCIRDADAALGRIIAALDDAGLAESTIVVFVTDHGSPFPRGKSTLFDPGVQTAMMLRLPEAYGIAPGRVAPLASHVDLVPTLLGLIGVAVPAAVQGVDLTPQLRGEVEQARDQVWLEKTYHGEYDPIRAIRTPQWKFVLNFEPRPLLQLPLDLEGSLTRQGMGDDHLEPRPMQELYDLTADPDEVTNLAEDPVHAEVRDRLHRQLLDFLAETGDRLLDGPIPNPDPAAA